MGNRLRELSKGFKLEREGLDEEIASARVTDNIATLAYYTVVCSGMLGIFFIIFPVAPNVAKTFLTGSIIWALAEIALVYHQYRFNKKKEEQYIRYVEFLKSKGITEKDLDDDNDTSFVN